MAMELIVTLLVGTLNSWTVELIQQMGALMDVNLTMLVIQLYTSSLELVTLPGG